MRSARWFTGAIRLSPAAYGLTVLTVLAVVGCGATAGPAGDAGTGADASRPAVGRAAAPPGAGSAGAASAGAASPGATESTDDELQIPPAGPIVVEARQDARGAVLTDAAGFTLYTFTADGPRASRCTGQCAARWRPASGGGGKPQAGTGVSAADIGSIRRDDGSSQVTYRTAPLYYFAGDAIAGERNGADRDEFGGRFTCVPPVDNDKD